MDKKAVGGIIIAAALTLSLSSVSCASYKVVRDSIVNNTDKVCFISPVDSNIYNHKVK